MLDGRCRMPAGMQLLGGIPSQGLERPTTRHLLNKLCRYRQESGRLKGHEWGGDGWLRDV